MFHLLAVTAFLMPFLIRSNGMIVAAIANNRMICCQGKGVVLNTFPPKNISKSCTIKITQKTVINPLFFVIFENMLRPSSREFSALNRLKNTKSEKNAVKNAGSF